MALVCYCTRISELNGLMTRINTELGKDTTYQSYYTSCKKECEKVSSNTVTVLCSNKFLESNSSIVSELCCDLDVAKQSIFAKIQNKYASLSSEKNRISAIDKAFHEEEKRKEEEAKKAAEEAKKEEERLRMMTMNSNPAMESVRMTQ